MKRALGNAFGPSLHQLWEVHEERLVRQWIVRAPGTRPSCWWRWSAPRIPVGAYPGWWFDGALPEPRRRLGGIGTPAHEVLAYAPSFRFGIPAHWVEQRQVDYYNGRAITVDGERFGTQHHDGDFTGQAIDPTDPPVYESQASYLERHGLLLPGERKRLSRHDFEPEFVLPPEDAE